VGRPLRALGCEPVEASGRPVRLRIENGEPEAFARTLGPEDHVVLESTALTWPIAVGAGAMPATRCATRARTSGSSS